MKTYPIKNLDLKNYVTIKNAHVMSEKVKANGEGYNILCGRVMFEVVYKVEICGSFYLFAQVLII